MIGLAWVAGRAAEPWPADLAPFFAPPAGAPSVAHPSPLRFADGRPVSSAAEWPARRVEILSSWHRLMGPWPPLVERPAFDRQERRDRGGGVTEFRVELEVAPGVLQPAYLLLPGRPGPRPAVLVLFYAPEVSIAYDGPRELSGQARRFLTTGDRGRGRDFALQLARRGFVTLSLGTPGDDAYHPDLHGATCQPLSYHAYLAANAHTALARQPEVDARRIGVMGHSYGGKWALFASCLDERFACAVWSDAGIVFDEARPAVNYWESWYLGREAAVTRQAGRVTAANPRTGAYRALVEAGHDLTELHALMAPRPFLVSGGSEDGAGRWPALLHAVAVNRLLGQEGRVGLTLRPAHAPTPESNAQAYRFLEVVLRP